MTDWINGLNAWQVVLLTLAIIAGTSVLSLIVGAVLVRLGMRRPRVVSRASSLAEGAIRLVKRPLTVVVLEEVSAVMQTGHYSKNISDALVENHDELKALVAEKVSDDPNVRLISRLPGYSTIVGEVTETTLRVLIEMLSDPRTDELINDLLRNNLEQIKVAVRARDHERVDDHAVPDELSAKEQQVARRHGAAAAEQAAAPRDERRFLGGPGAI